MYEYHKQELKYEIKNLREDLTNRYKQMIKKEIYKVHNLIEYEYQSHKKKHKIPQQAIKEHILELIESMHYDKNTYIFILDYNCNNVLHPHKKTLITKKAKLKTQCLQSGTDIIHIAKNGEGYLSYLFMQKNKLSYIKSFEPFQWAIGYGFYPDEIEKMINQNIEKLKTVHLKHLFTVLILTLLITFMLSFILFKLAKKINEIC